MGGVRGEIERLLRERLGATEVSVEDETSRHAGHREAAAGGHFRVRVVAARFRGLAPLARHRLVHEALAPVLGGIHALALEVRAPGETL